MKGQGLGIESSKNRVTQNSVQDRGTLPVEDEDLTGSVTA